MTTQTLSAYILPQAPGGPRLVIGERQMVLIEIQRPVAEALLRRLPALLKLYDCLAAGQSQIAIGDMAGALRMTGARWHVNDDEDDANLGLWLDCDGTPLNTGIAKYFVATKEAFEGYLQVGIDHA